MKGKRVVGENMKTVRIPVFSVLCFHFQPHPDIPLYQLISVLMHVII